MNDKLFKRCLNSICLSKEEIDKFYRLYYTNPLIKACMMNFLNRQRDWNQALFDIIVNQDEAITRLKNYIIKLENTKTSTIIETI